MTEDQYGSVVTQNPAGQYNTLVGGNPDLVPETADTITAGIVWTPQSISGLSVTLDYYDIRSPMQSALSGRKTSSSSVPRPVILPPAT